MKKHPEKLIHRRSFLKLGSLGAAVAGLAPFAGAQTAESAGSAADSGASGGPVFRALGRTGLKVSIVSFGAMQTRDVPVMHAVFDAGVNYLDTARSYMGGENERIVGEALKGRRDKVYLATKTRLGDKDAVMRSAETSLSEMNVDYVDVLQLHNLTSREAVMNEGAREGLKELRKQGKVRHLGVTTHSKQVDVINAVLEDPEKLFDVVLVAYNFKAPPELKDAIARAAKAGVGVIAMKTQAGGYQTDALGPISPHQAALKWVLQDPHVAAAIPSMTNLDQVKENVEVMGMRFARVDQQILDAYARATRSTHCQLCQVCEPSCPRGVAISDMNRALMYAEGYGDFDLARSAFCELPRNASSFACGDCVECVARCAHGLDIGAKMARARTLFA